ncbi:hypothetical protein Adt_34005 [Abeliophyllum distichum]|uniref:Uncharacterized protein n=1 Tax=Abeliophyllum distichum TaxID=126358 RepID=A0ABD1QXW3_9LAMI
MGGASCKVAESQWERPLSEAVLHGRSKLQGGRVLVLVLVEEALERSCAPWEEQAASATGRDTLGCVGGEASPSVSPSMEGVLPIRGVDGSTGEAIPIDAAPSLREADDPFRVDVVSSVSGCPKWMESNGGRQVFVVSALVRHGNAFPCVPNHLSAEEVAEEEGQRGGSRVVLLMSLGSHKPLVTVCLSSIKQWKESWFWVSDSLPRCELSRDIVDVLRSIYQADPKTQSYGLILNRHRCLVELGLMASNAEIDQGKHPRPTLAHLMKQRPKVLVLGSAEDTS